MTLANGATAAAASLAAVPPQEFHHMVVSEVAAGDRITAMFGVPMADRLRLHAVLADDRAGALRVRTTEVADAYPSLTPRCPQAHLFEREIHEQHAARPAGHPWLKPVRDHSGPHPFFRVEGEELHEVAVGPVHAGIIDPGHFRLQCHGEKVLSLEIQLGYQHRGIERGLEGGPDRRSALLAECIAGDTTIGHAIAFAEAMESLGGCEPPPRAMAIRAAALEMERIASHVGDLGALAGDVGYLPAAAWLGRLRGDFLNMLASVSGSRFGRGLVRPGGVLFDLDGPMAEDLSRRLGRARPDLTEVAGLLFETPSVRARLEGVGALTRQVCEDLGLVGPPARACGVTRDVRHDHPSGFDGLARIPVASATTGDVLARARVRWVEVGHSLEFLDRLLRSLPCSETLVECPPPAAGRLAVAMVEGWRGEITHCVVTDGVGRIARYKVKDPSFHNWAGLAMAMRGMQVSDFPLCNKSFNLSYAGHDL